MSGWRRALSITLVLACGSSSSSPVAHAPEPEPAQVAPSQPPSRTRLGQACEVSTGCDDSTSCVFFCAGQVAGRDDCDERSTHGFCADSERKRSVPLRELALVFVADGLHIRVADHDEAMDEARVLRVVEDEAEVSGLAAGYRMGRADAELQGRRFDVLGARGRVCTAVVDSTWIVGLEPLETWAGADLPNVGDAVDDMHYANQNGAVYRTLRLEPEGDCRDALWVRDASLPRIGHAGTSAREVTQEELGAYRSLGVFPMMQQLFETYDAEHDGEWIAGDGRGFGPSAWDVVVNRDARVVVSTWVGDACWGFEGTLMAVFRDHEVESISWRTHGALRPDVALDVDGDGRLELIEHDGFATRFFSPTLTTPTTFRAAAASTGC